MQRSRLPLAALLICLGSGSTAHGGVSVMPPPGPARVARADAVLVGRVVALEPVDVKVGTTTYRIAVVKIDDKIRGIKDEKTLRVGFIPLLQPMPGQPLVRISGARPVQLQAGQHGLLLLEKVDKEGFYTIGGVVGGYINSEQNDGFDKEVAAAKAAAKVMDNLQASLKAKDADERLLAASILIDKYRTYRGSPKQEPIDAEESKQIMQMLAEADADWRGPINPMSLRANPQHLFHMLGVTSKDGLILLKGGDSIPTWLRENAQKYRIQRFVAGNAK